MQETGRGLLLHLQRGVLDPEALAQHQLEPPADQPAVAVRR